MGLTIYKKGDVLTLNDLYLNPGCHKNSYSTDPIAIKEKLFDRKGIGYYQGTKLFY